MALDCCLFLAYLVSQPSVTSSSYAKVHEKPLISNLVCPHVVESGVLNKCNVFSNRQGYDYQLSWSTSNDTYIEAHVLNFPGLDRGLRLYLLLLEMNLPIKI